MKGFLTVLLTVVISLNCFGENDNTKCYGIVFEINIEKLSFDVNHNWKINLYYFFGIPTCEKSGISEFDIIDSVYLSSSTKKSKIRTLDFLNYGRSDTYFELNKDSFLSALDIDRHSDSLTLEIYINEIFVSQYPERFKSNIIKINLVYGNFKTSVVSELKESESIIYENKFCKLNEEKNIWYGYLKGKIYDKDNQLLKSDPGYEYEYPLIIDAEGNYELKVNARKDTLRFFTDSYVSHNAVPVVYIEDLIFDIEPDSIKYIDIHLKEFDNVVDNKVSRFIKTYPNPAIEKINFKLFKNSSGTLNIYNSFGQIVIVSHFYNTNKTDWNIPLSMNPGIYFFNIRTINLESFTGKFVVGR